MARTPIPISIGCRIIGGPVGDCTAANNCIIEFDIWSLEIGLSGIIAASCSRTIHKARCAGSKWCRMLIKHGVFCVTSAIVRANVDNDIRDAVPDKILSKKMCIPA